MDPSVWLGVIALGTAVATAVVAPAVTIALQNRGKRQEKETEVEAHSREKREDWARQDQVADRLIEANREVARMAAQSSATTDAKLDKAAAATAVIHTLVNSTLTEAKKVALRALRTSLIAITDLNELGTRIIPPIFPSPERLAEIDSIRSQITELEIELAGRAAAATVVDDQLTEQRKAGTAPESDDRTAIATERVAVATERVAAATESNLSK